MLQGLKLRPASRQLCNYKYHVIGVACLANQHPKSTIKGKKPTLPLHTSRISQNISAFVLRLAEIRRKTQRCRKNVYDGLENAYCKQKCDRSVCELWIAECALFRLES